MLERSSVTIAGNKTKEFKEFLEKNAVNKEFWRKNKYYLATHKVDLDKLEALYNK
ncbi:MAG: hypothetical protein IJI25_08745 [Eubacterium sp.]|nr:hypothetical protein [Eubacterium sp.]